MTMNFEKRMQSWRQRMERELSFNQGARIPDRPVPVEINPDDEMLDDLNFVEQGVAVEPFVLAAADPDLEDNFGNEEDAEYDEDDHQPAAEPDPYAEMAERLGVRDEDIRGDDDTFDLVRDADAPVRTISDAELVSIIEAGPWERGLEASKQAQIAEATRALEDDRFDDSREYGASRRPSGSWKQTTRQAAQFLRHARRGIRAVQTIRWSAEPFILYNDLDEQGGADAQDVIAQDVIAFEPYICDDLDGIESPPSFY